MANDIKNVFISHHHRDDAHVDKLSKLLENNGCTIRNSSIRAKPANQQRVDRGLVKVATIRRLLRMKMSWAGTVIVLVGEKTHTRPWVDWEITEAHKQGKHIVGVYEYGLKGQDVELPKALKEYGTSQVVGWDPEAIIDAINGKPVFQNSDGMPCLRKAGSNSVC